MILAVPAAMSNQGILSRYAEQVADRGHGRLTVQANADRAYNGVLDLAAVIEREGLADYAAVFRRGEDRPRYAITPHASSGRQPAARSLGDAITRERERTWTAHEAADFLRAHRKLQAQLGPDWAARLKQIQRQAETLLPRQRGHRLLHVAGRADPEADPELEAGA